MLLVIPSYWVPVISRLQSPDIVSCVECANHLVCMREYSNSARAAWGTLDAPLAPHTPHIPKLLSPPLVPLPLALCF